MSISILSRRGACRLRRPKTIKCASLLALQISFPPRKTAGWRYAPPEKKPPQRAAISVVLPFWCNFTLSREPSSSGTVSEPRRLCGQARTRPTRKTLCIFFEVSPAVIFWIWKRVFLAVRLPQAVEAARLQSAKPTRYAPQPGSLVFKLKNNCRSICK